MHGMANSTDVCSGMGMKMFFHWGYCETLLFEAWTITSPGFLAVACILTFLISILVEALHVYELRLGPGQLALQAVAHVVSNILGFGVMLVVMGYHAGLFLAAVLGRMVGYLFFAWLRPPRMFDSVDCCH